MGLPDHLFETAATIVDGNSGITGFLEFHFPNASTEEFTGLREELSSLLLDCFLDGADLLQMDEQQRLAAFSYTDHMPNPRAFCQNHES